VVQAVSGADQVAYVPPKGAPLLPSPFHHLRSKKKARVQDSNFAGDAAGVEIIRAHAKQATAGLMLGIKQRLVYGFSTTNYQLAVQTSGVIPIISANELPPRFEQYLIVEITINIDGRVLMRGSLLEWQLPRLSKPCSRPFANSSTSPPSAMARRYHARSIWSFTFRANVCYGVFHFGTLYKTKLENFENC
jgi:hypothetical protein